MRNSQQGAIPSELAWLIDQLDDFSERIRKLEAPSGEALNSTVAKLQSLVSDIQAQLDAWTASRWTNAQISTQINAQIGSALGGNVTIGGQFKAPDAIGFNITTTRRTAWLEDATGRLGYAASTERVKTGIHAADADRLLALLDVEPKSFYYREEIRRRTRMRINSDEEYDPPRELGLIAEELDAAGLREFVIYDPEGIPEGIEYGMLTVALLGIARAQRDDIAEIKAHLGLES